MASDSSNNLYIATHLVLFDTAGADANSYILGPNLSTTDPITGWDCAFGLEQGTDGSWIGSGYMVQWVNGYDTNQYYLGFNITSSDVLSVPEPTGILILALVAPITLRRNQRYSESKFIG